MAFPLRKSAPPKKKRDDEDALAGPSGFDGDPDDTGEGPPDNDEDDPAAPKSQPAGDTMVTPAAVAYRTGDETCGNCRYMGPDGLCDVLHINVAPPDSCMAFSDSGESNEEDTSQGPPPPPGPPAGPPAPRMSMGGAPPPQGRRY